MAPRSVSELDLDGRRVLIRADFDVPLTPARGIEDPTRIRQALPTIEHALEKTNGNISAAAKILYGTFEFGI